MSMALRFADRTVEQRKPKRQLVLRTADEHNINKPSTWINYFPREAWPGSTKMVNPLVAVSSKQGHYFVHANVSVCVPQVPNVRCYGYDETQDPRVNVPHLQIWVTADLREGRELFLQQEEGEEEVGEEEEGEEEEEDASDPSPSGTTPSHSSATYFNIANLCCRRP